jgi:hypothetical protein
MSVLFVSAILGVLLTGAGVAGERLVQRHSEAELQSGAFALATGWAILCLVCVVCAVSGARLTFPALAVGIAGVAGYLTNRGAWAGLRYLAWPAFFCCRWRPSRRLPLRRCRTSFRICCRMPKR